MIECKHAKGTPVLFIEKDKSVCALCVLQLAPQIFFSILPVDSLEAEVPAPPPRPKLRLV